VTLLLTIPYGKILIYERPKRQVGGNKKQRIYNVENFDVSFAYSQNDHHDIDFEYDNQEGLIFEVSVAMDENYMLDISQIVKIIQIRLLH